MFEVDQKLFFIESADTFTHRIKSCNFVDEIKQFLSSCRYLVHYNGELRSFFESQLFETREEAIEHLIKELDKKIEHAKGYLETQAKLMAKMKADIKKWEDAKNEIS